MDLGVPGNRPNLIDLTGMRFGYLTVISRCEKKDGEKKAKWLCRCDCGNYHTATSGNLRRGSPKSCGCKTKELSAASRLGGAIKPKPNVKCAFCGKEFHLKPYAIKRAKTHYCSKACQNEAKKIYMSGEGNHQFGLKGEKNASWNGGTRITRYGYRAVQQIGHPFAVDRSEYVLEHRVVAEKYLLNDENSVVIDGKRYLSPDFVVHHINGNRLDNRVENLKVMTLSEHQSLHAKVQNKSRQRDVKGRFMPDTDALNRRGARK